MFQIIPPSAIFLVSSTVPVVGPSLRDPHVGSVKCVKIQEPCLLLSPLGISRFDVRTKTIYYFAMLCVVQSKRLKMVICVYSTGRLLSLSGSLVGRIYSGDVLISADQLQLLASFISPGEENERGEISLKMV